MAASRQGRGINGCTIHVSEVQARGARVLKVSVPRMEKWHRQRGSRRVHCFIHSLLNMIDEDSAGWTYQGT